MAKVVDIFPQQVKERLEAGEKLNIIDVREQEEVATGKIPGAKHIRLSEIPDRLKEIDPNTETIFVCRSGGRSGKVCEFLSSMGYNKIRNMVGGMTAWTGNVEK
ncbi:rhodanese-like domain-containing protein [Aneurinibacillus terranovensis]|uniref:rhodanese-like domain-containing protein n=1 Tax=Aneurinibacillus terranovensis TaxID=278991 RepID=UPI0004263D7B|nr:rhodanese-like domain-containing protein [Aneurinibacillus terranovensis]